MLIGKLENAKIECLRELHHEESDCKIIPLCVKQTQSSQKFRIPFKNSSATQEAEFEFTFVKLPQSDGNDDASAIQCLEFYCQPSNMKMASGQQGFLNVLIKVNQQKMQELSPAITKQPINKLLIARLKDTNLLFSFFVNITLVSERV